jgi:hypothetical protein
MEDEQDIQDKILSVHHSFMLTFQKTAAVKIVENHLGVAYIEIGPQQPPVGFKPVGLEGSSVTTYYCCP